MRFDANDEPYDGRRGRGPRPRRRHRARRRAPLLRPHAAPHRPDRRRRRGISLLAPARPREPRWLASQPTDSTPMGSAWGSKRIGHPPSGSTCSARWGLASTSVVTPVLVGTWQWGADHARQPPHLPAEAAGSPGRRDSHGTPRMPPFSVASANFSKLYRTLSNFIKLHRTSSSFIEL